MNPWVIALPCLMYLSTLGTFLGSPQIKVDAQGSRHECSDGYHDALLPDSRYCERLGAR